jgi:hypothetical protein
MIRGRRRILTCALFIREPGDSLLDAWLDLIGTTIAHFDVDSPSIRSISTLLVSQAAMPKPFGHAAYATV